MPDTLLGRLSGVAKIEDRVKNESGTRTKYGYDTESRLNSIAANLGGTPITSFSYLLDAAGNRTRKTTLDWAEDYKYDETYRLMSADRSAGTPTRWRFAYDAAGNRTAAQTDDAVMSATFNEVNELLSRQPGGALTFSGTTNEPTSVTVAGAPVRTASDNSFSTQTPVGPGTTDVTVVATDPAGNARTNTYRVTTSGTGATYTYDSNGNLSTKTEGSDTWGYEWNANDELTRVTKNSTEQARFSYDPRGRRVEKVVGGATTSYTYDEFGILRETRGAVALKYVHGPEVDEPLAVDDGTALSYFHGDALGSIVKSTNAAGAVTLVREYDAWGTLQAGAAQPGYSFTGREWDPEVGLHFYRSRYYDPQLGRFISEDMIGFDGGENFFAYVTNSPTNTGDPFGFCGLGGCGAKMSPTPPEPTPPPTPTCIAPKDYPCPCPLVERYDNDKYWDCMKSLGAAGGGPKAARGVAYYGKKQYKPVVNPPAVCRRQGQNASMAGGMALLIQIPRICREAARECVPMGSPK